MFENITDKEWATFFKVLDKIFEEGGTWQEKRDALKAEARSQGSETALEEIANWFQE